ncbi:hypothetical protein ACU610_07095 [Geodermatophilus sp. URMC 61]|uniref:hypothetical protein n=1 Tax=Geodermatophilus sp. URMC 61 TaxID=3423411 RepID=UPI00406D0B90
MPTYRVSEAAVARAERLIDDGGYDDHTAWSDAAPDAVAANASIDSAAFDAFAAWHLAEDADASEGTKGRYAFPYGARPIAGSHREPASGGGQWVLPHDAIEKVADDLLRRLDAHRES